MAFEAERKSNKDSVGTCSYPLKYNSKSVRAFTRPLNAPHLLRASKLRVKSTTLLELLLET